MGDKPGTGRFGPLSGLALSVVLCMACSDAERSCPIGAESCDCTEGGGCDPGLICLSHRCVNPGGSDGDADADADADTDGDADLLPVACPETNVQLSIEVEPNDTLQQATDACTSHTAEDDKGPYATGICPTGTLGPAGVDDVDYYVFRTATDVADQLVSGAVEWEPATDLLDLQIFDITEGTVGGEPFYVSATEDTGQEGSDRLSMPAGHTFVLELRLRQSAASATPYYGQCQLCEWLDERPYDCR